jgi:hypothetical protein
MKETLILAKLNGNQIVLAKTKNGERKQITHAVLCGKYGQIFGTETHCNKYYSVWSRIFPLLFEKAIEASDIEIEDYQGTPNLVNILIEENDKLSPKLDLSFLDKPSSKT